MQMKLWRTYYEGGVGSITTGSIFFDEMPGARGANRFCLVSAKGFAEREGFVTGATMPDVIWPRSQGLRAVERARKEFIDMRIMASIMGEGTDRSFVQLLNAKAQRYTGGKIAYESFSKLLTVEGVPDIVSAIMSGEISMAKVWKFRNTRIANEFRQWFDHVGPANPVALTSEYIKSLKSGGFLSGWKGKVLRFIVLQAVGASLIPVTSGTSFIVSMGLSAVDCFLLDKVRLGFKPRYFVDELHTLFPKLGASNN